MRPRGVSPSPVFEPTPYVNNTIKMFDYLRSKIGFDVELIHDVHERVPPTQAIVLAKAVEPFRLFYLEDVLAPEDVAWFQMVRQQTSTPLAMGELFVNRNEWLPLVANRWIDFIRMSHFGDRRPQPGAQDRGHLRDVRRPDSLARPRQRLAGGPRGESAPRSVQLQFRHPGREPVFAIQCARCFPARRRSQADTCTPTTRPAGESTSTRTAAAKYPVQSRGRQPRERPAAWTAASCGRDCELTLRNIANLLSKRPQNGAWVADSRGRLLPNIEGRDRPFAGQLGGEASYFSLLWEVDGGEAAVDPAGGLVVSRAASSSALNMPR